MGKHAPVITAPESLGSDGRRRLRRRKALGLLFLFCVVVVPLLLFGAAPWALVAYDRAHIVTRSCEVGGAETGSSAGRSLRGIGSSGPQVVITSPNCGKLVLDEGVSRENATDIAEMVSDEARVRVDMGAGSIQLEDLLRAVGLSTEIYGVRPEPASEKD